MRPILQDSLPVAPWMDPRLARLPGTVPAGVDDWARPDEAYAGQMARRDQLLSERRGDVLAMQPEAVAPAQELLSLGLCLAARTPGFAPKAGFVLRPGGVRVPVDGGDPMGTLGRLFQEDLCILTRPTNGREHILSAAVLCFPAGWTLAEKIGRPMERVHRPVPDYSTVSHRVQRLFDGLRPGKPIRRVNAHLYDDPELFQPLGEADPKPVPERGDYVRSELQVLFRLPETGAVVFSIHTVVVARDRLSPEQASTVPRRAAEPD